LSSLLDSPLLPKKSRKDFIKDLVTDQDLIFPPLRIHSIDKDNTEESFVFETYVREYIYREKSLPLFVSQKE
jgi:hypothetical protein